MPGHIGTKVVSNSASVLGQDLPFAGLAEAFENQAPTTAAQAATIILDGVKAGKWCVGYTLPGVHGLTEQ